MTIPTFSDVQGAYYRVQKYIHHTPVHTSESVNRILGCHLYFKCENFQKVGAFKFRGACNAVLSLTDEELLGGVATHSSGNHAAALALAAKMKGVKAHIVMPSNAPSIKQEAVKGYGGIITFCEPTLQAREQTLERIVKETGSVFIHPYNHPQVISGQGTAALELFNEVSGLDVIMTPVGGGGLLSGTAIVARHVAKGCRVIACEPLGADDAYQSFKQGKIVPSISPKTIADGLLTSLGTLTFEIIRNNVDDIITVKEESIIKAMKLVWERMKLIIEPSSAVPLAAVMENQSLFKKQKVGIILSGGNVDLGKLPF
jgi:threonine dehydratase